MKNYLCESIGGLVCGLAWLSTAALLPAESAKLKIDEAAGQGTLIWRTVPGKSYHVEESTDLLNWSGIPNSPVEADSLSELFSFGAGGDSRFFRITLIDLAVPLLEEQLPRDGAKGVGRFADFSFVLSDESGIDPTSLSLAVGDGAALTLESSPELAWDGSVLSVDLGGDVAWGEFGETVQATLVAADTEGNTLVHTFGFRLELEDVVTTDVFVFGSVQAQRSGQRIATPTAVVARTAPGAGPIRMDDPAEWTIEEVSADAIVISYVAPAPPAFSVGQYLANATPGSEDEIFYRRITAIADDAAKKELRLSTVDVGLVDIVEQGSINLDSGALLFEDGGDGQLTRAVDFDFVYNLPELGQNADGQNVYESGNLRIWLPQANWSFRPRLEVSLEVKQRQLEEFSAYAKGDFEAALQAQLDITGSLGDEFHTDPPLFEGKKYVFIGWIGVVPVWVELVFQLNASAGYSLEADASASLGVTQTAEVEFGVVYRPGDDPETEWEHYTNVGETGVIPFTYTINGSANVWAQLEPRFDVVVNSLAGVYAELVPRLDVDGSFSVTDGVVTAADWSSHLTGTLNAGVSLPLTPGLEELIPKLSYEVFEKSWGQSYRAGEPTELAITMQPSGGGFEEGSDVVLEVAAVAPGAIEYQWYFNGDVIDGATGSRLELENIPPTFAGEYYVHVTSGANELESDRVVLTVRRDRLEEEPRWVKNPANGHLYALVFGDESWPDAQAKAEAEGAYLATVTSAAEWDFILASFPAEALSGVLLGGTDEGTEGEWRWVTGEPWGFTRWASWEPDNRSGDTGSPQHYLRIFTALTWGDVAIDDFSSGYLMEYGSGRDGVPSEGFAPVPGGSYLVGDSSGVGDADELPRRRVDVSAFHIGKTEVTKGYWDEVRDWAVDHGYGDLPAGGGNKGANHPVHSISWYSMLKWCNARSEMDGLEPCYHVDGSIYRTGQRVPTCEWGASGYRLPTEAEWEIAARGGLDGARYPWGDAEISSSLANYGYHFDGSLPKTSPVGSYAPNGYGLYDMAGNLWEWCWDWYAADFYGSSPESDPRGPSSGTVRVARGGGWDSIASHCRVASRRHDVFNPSATRYNGLGFRVVKRQVP